MKTIKKGETRPLKAAGRHFYQFYKGRDDLFRVTVPFLRHGLENGEACLWVVSSSIGVSEAVEALQRECALELFVERGQLAILPAEKWYLERGRFSEGKVLEKIRKFLEDKKRRGFDLIRGVTDAGWVEEKDWFKFQVYEEKAHALIQSFSVTAVCTYPIYRCSLTQTRSVLAHHDGVFPHLPPLR